GGRGLEDPPPGVLRLLGTQLGSVRSGRRRARIRHIDFPPRVVNHLESKSILTGGTMSSYLITTTPAHRHVAPLLTIARHLIARGHRVRFLTGAKYADAVTAAGAEFLPIPPDSDIDLHRVGDLFPQRAGLAGSAA